jgi:hypothetical protein
MLSFSFELGGTTPTKERSEAPPSPKASCRLVRPAALKEASSSGSKIPLKSGGLVVAKGKKA